MLGPDAILQLLHRLVQAPTPLPLHEVAAQSGWSPFHLHRRFRATVGETPRQFQGRLQLQRALALLATTDVPVRQVAERAGFRSHPVFTRAFRAAFGCTPTEFRVRTGGTWTPDQARRVEQIGRCVGLLGFGAADVPRRVPMSDIRLETRGPVPALFVRRRVAPSELAATFAECLPAVFVHCQSHGLAMAGAPFARYPEVGRGLLTVECGMPLAAPATGEGNIEAGELSGGRIVVAVHAGPYDTLHETHAAIERWIAEQGLESAGPPWESYVTDPTDHPDPADWRTEVCWPVAG